MDKIRSRLIGALYGNELPPTEREIREAIAKRSGRRGGEVSEKSEANHQARFVAYLRRNNILFYHVPNGGYRRKEEAYHLKAQGVQPGVPDIVIPIARKPYHGLYIELKREIGGVLSEAQKWWLNELTCQQYQAVCCHGFDECQQTLLKYLNLPRWE